MISRKNIAIISQSAQEVESLIASIGGEFTRYATLSEFIRNIKIPAALIIPANSYPDSMVDISNDEWRALLEAGHRIYAEFVDNVPDCPRMEIVQASRLERAYMSNEIISGGAKILSLSAPKYIKYEIPNALVRIGKVAGYDRLAFDIANELTDPVLFHASAGNLLVASTRLTSFRQSRFAPKDSVQELWRYILGWLIEEPAASLPEYSLLCRPEYSEKETLPANSEETAISKSIHWFYNAGMLLSESQEGEYCKVADDDYFFRTETGGDGSGGVLEGYVSEVNHFGKQPHRWWRRADCTGEVAGSFALSSLLSSDGKERKVAENLLDWLVFSSRLIGGIRQDVKSPACGLLGWHDRPRYARFHHADGWDIYYGDDNARAILGMIAVAGSLKIERWNQAIVRGILANYRTSGPHGLRKNAIWNDELTQKGWKHFFDNEELDEAWISPHYQCYLSACYLWLYQQTGDEMLFDHGNKGIRLLMEAYPKRWRWTNGLQQERARMLLPLAWLFRITKDPLHRAWLNQMAEDLLAHQTPCGAIREVLAEGNGKYGPPQKHEDYGTREASLLQKDGDSVADLLYTCNFAFLGLHEAAEATGDNFYRNAEERLSRFLARIQTKSEDPAYDGVWYRAFDFSKWEVWGSDADGAWGAWCVETGWTQAWITSVFALRRKTTSLWELPVSGQFRDIYYREKADMLVSSQTENQPLQTVR